MIKKTPRSYTQAIVKWNSFAGALLCNRCKTIIATGFDHEDIEHYCSKCKSKYDKSA